MTHEKPTNIPWRNLGFRAPGSELEFAGKIPFSVKTGQVVVPDHPEVTHVGNLASPAAVRLADFAIHEHNLLEAEAGFEAVASGEANGANRALIRVLWAGAVVAYCRCFAGPNCLSAETIFGAKPLGLQAHQDVWTQRNKHFAHDVNDQRQALVAALLDDAGEFVAIGQWQGLSQFNNVFLLNARLLVRDALAFVQNERKALEDALSVDVRAMTPAQRLALPEPVLVAGDWDSAKSSRRKNSGQ